MLYLSSLAASCHIEARRPWVLCLVRKKNTKKTRGCGQWSIVMNCDSSFPGTKILNPSFFNAVSRSQSRPPFFPSSSLPSWLRAGMGTSPYRIFKQINQLAVCAEFSLSVAAGGSGLNPRQRGDGRCAASVLLSSTYSCAQWGQHVTPSSTQSIPSATLRARAHSTIWVCSTPFSIPTHRGQSAARAAKYTSCAVILWRSEQKQTKAG